MRISSILKHFSFYGEYEDPILSVVKEASEEYSNIFEYFFEDIDFCIEEEIDYSKKYNTIIFDTVDSIPLKIKEVLNKNAVVYVFSNKDIIENILLDQFNYVKKDIFNPVLRILNNKFVNFMKFDYENEELFIYRASDLMIEEARYNFEISLNLIEEIVSNIYKYRDIVFGEKLYYESEKLKEKLSILKAKNNYLLKLNNKIRLDYKENLVKKEIYYIIKLIDTIKEDINNDFKNGKLFACDNDTNIKLKTLELENKIRIKDKEINELKVNNKKLIEENNKNISRLSHFEFDFNDLLEEKRSLEDSILELEELLEKSESIIKEKDIKFKRLESENLKLKIDLSRLVKEVKKLRS